MRVVVHPRACCQSQIRAATARDFGEISPCAEHAKFGGTKHSHSDGGIGFHLVDNP
jgi:hypothetical protein